LQKDKELIPCGLPYREERLYSAICPVCGLKMEEEPDRRVKCQCGFETHRDEVPALWAQRRFRELITPPFSIHIFAVAESILNPLEKYGHEERPPTRAGPVGIRNPAAGPSRRAAALAGTPSPRAAGVEMGRP